MVTKTLLMFLVVVLTWVAPVSARSEAKAPAGVSMPGTTILAAGKALPKSQTTTAPRPTSAAPLTAAECEGLGGTVVQQWTCMAVGGKACSTVDPNGVVRTKCLNLQ